MSSYSNKFLNDGNYIAIVTTAIVHGSVGYIIDDFFTKKFSIYAIGNNYRDIPMLLRTQELDGFSSFIGNSIDDEVSVKDIIIEQLFVKFHFPLQDEINKKKGG